MELNPDTLRENIIDMATITEKSINQCIEPEFSIKDIFELEKKINDFHKQVDDNCFKYIALKRPVARDLRLALSIMKINSELERIGDQAVNIKRYQNKINTIPTAVKDMGVEVNQMLNNVISAFIQGDINLASDVIQSDQVINEVHRDIIRTYLSMMQNQETSFEEGFCIMKVAKNLERVGDLATNIAEDIIFLESGTDIRHNPEYKFGKTPNNNGESNE